MPIHEIPKSHRARFGKSHDLLCRRPRSSSARLRLDGYFADIMCDEAGVVYHWVVQPLGSPEIMRMGQEKSFRNALQQGHRCLENLCERSGTPQRGVLYEFGVLQK